MEYRSIKKLRQRTRKFMTMNGALHPKSDIDRGYILAGKWEEGIDKL